MKRYAVNKGKSARKFRNDMRTTKAANLANPMRGGWRL